MKYPLACLAPMLASTLLSHAAPLTPASQPPLPPDSEDAAYPAIQRFIEVLHAVRNRHPDAQRLSYERLINHSLEGMLSSLDPHSSFIHPEMAASLKAAPNTQTEIPSLGIGLALRDDGPYIATVAPKSVADAAQIQPGCSLLEINQQPTKDMEFADLLALLQQPAGSQTSLLVSQIHNAHPKTITLTHAWVDEKSVTDSKFLTNTKIGYIRLATFGSGCANEIDAALDDLENAGMTSLALDLRHNGGGRLDEAVKILGLFLPPSTTVVTTKGRGEDVQADLKTPARQRKKREYPLAILIDSMSASASELTAGCLQDLKRATVIGELSYGKGSVQEIIPMPGQTALRLTIATYHTPSGRTPHQVGITPDQVIALKEMDHENFLLSTHPQSLTETQKTTLHRYQDPVIAATIQTLSKAEQATK